MKDFLDFKKMITPIIIQIMFGIGIAACVAGGIGMLVSGDGGANNLTMGLVLIFVGPVVVRIYCELLIVLFSINDTLTETMNLMKSRAQ
jgi:hypothetical protein